MAKGRVTLKQKSKSYFHDMPIMSPSFTHSQT